MINGYDKETLSEILRGRREKIAETMPDSITAIPLTFREVRDDGSILFSLTPEHWMRNPSGVMHGGIICTAFDNAMGTVSCIVSNKMTPTVNMQVDFVRPVRLDTVSTIRVEVISAGKTLCRLRAELWQDNEAESCATGSAVYFAK